MELQKMKAVIEFSFNKPYGVGRAADALMKLAFVIIILLINASIRRFLWDLLVTALE